MIPDPQWMYACCRHCDEDAIHDLEPNTHEIPCNSVIWPDSCEEGSRRVAADDQ